MPGYPDWQNYPQWAGPITAYAIDSLLLAGATVQFEDIETVHYRNIYAIIGCRNQPARFRFRFRDEAWAIVPELGAYAYVNTLDQLHFVIPNMGGLFEAVQVTAAAAGNVNFDLWIIPTNADAQAMYGSYSVPLLRRFNFALGVGLADTTNLRPYTGWAMYSCLADTSGGAFAILGLDHNSAEISRPVVERIPAGGSITGMVWIPPWNCQAIVVNTGAAGGTYSFHITPVWPHP